ncbi:oxidoreductase [Streptomyces sp. NPDC005438]|uniref:oxidoreductase n=1 Tax=Streptomyces sp. NPDC005438 TaxID=3156880 RepID=UPI0033AFA1B5
MSDLRDDGEPPANLQLTRPEWGLWQAFRNGSAYSLRSGEPERDDPNGDHEWGEGRTIRARVISSLLLHGPPPLLGRVASLHLAGAYISGVLDISGGEVRPYVELVDCRFERELLLPEARLTTMRLINCHVPRVEASRLTTEGDLHLPRCTVPEGIKLTDANIGTDLLLNELTVGSGRRPRAVSADGVNVSQDLQASLVLADGEVSLRGAQIGGSMFLYGTVIRNRRGRYSLHAPQLTVERFAHLADAGPGSAHMAQGYTPPTGVPLPFTTQGGTRRRVKHFEVTGGVKLDDGRFGDSLVLDNCRFQLERDQELSLRRVTTPELCFTSPAPERGVVVLSGATVENLVDKVSSWPTDERLWMAGFSYQHLINRGYFPLQQRLSWLAAATPEYSPEPYEQLATVKRNSGEDAEARAVLLEKQRRRRETLPLAAKLWGYLQDWTVAYGYRPGQAALWMAVLWATGFVFFNQHPPGALKSDEMPHWNAALYSLDLLLPVISFGQDTAWNPGGAAQWVAAVMILLGWVLATTVATGATRLLRRQ